MVSALVESLVAYDADRRSPHVAACVALDVRDRLRRGREAEVLRRRTLLAIKHIAERSEAAYVTGEQELASLIGGAHGAEVANDNEAERVEALAGKLVENRFLSSRDATILCRVAVQGRRIIEVAPELGVSVDVAKKALQRAKKRLFRQRKRLTIIFRSPPAR